MKKKGADLLGLRLFKRRETSVRKQGGGKKLLASRITVDGSSTVIRGIQGCPHASAGRTQRKRSNNFLMRRMSWDLPAPSECENLAPISELDLQKQEVVSSCPSAGRGPVPSRLDRGRYNSGDALSFSMQDGSRIRGEFVVSVQRCPGGRAPQVSTAGIANRQDLGGLGLAEARPGLCQARVRAGEDRHGEQTRVDGARFTDGESRDGDPGGHLHGRQQ